MAGLAVGALVQLEHPTPRPDFLQKCQGLVLYPLLGPWYAEGLVLYPTSGLFLICCGKKSTVKPVVRFAGCPPQDKKTRGRVRLRRVCFPPALGRHPLTPRPPPTIKPSHAPSIPLFLPFFPPSLPCARRHRLPPPALPLNDG